MVEVELREVCAWWCVCFTFKVSLVFSLHASVNVCSAARGGETFKGGRSDSAKRNIKFIST